MTEPRSRSGWRPGLRALVLSVSGALVVGTALLVSANVSDHLQRAAVDEAVRSTEAVVRGFVDPMIGTAGLANLTSGESAIIDAELEQLVSTGKILRIKVWAPDGTVVVLRSPCPARPHSSTSTTTSRKSLEGEIATGSRDGDRRGERLRARPRRAASSRCTCRSGRPASGEVVGVYEIYQDAAPILAHIDQTRRDVLVIVGAMARGPARAPVRSPSRARRALRLEPRFDQTPASFGGSQRGAVPVARPELGRRPASSLDADGDDRVRERRRRAGPRLSGRGSDRPDRARARPPRRPAPGPRRCSSDVARLPGRRWPPSCAFATPTAPGSSIEAVAQEPPRRSRRRRHRRQLPRHHRAQVARGRAQAPGLPRFADRPRQPRPVRGPARARDRRGPSGRRRRWRSCSSISTTSRRSTTASATARATAPRRGRGSPPGQRSAPATRSPGWAATSSRSSSRTRPTARRRSTSPAAARRSSQPPFVHGGKELFVRASVGDRHPRRSRDHTADELLRNADVAMYTAKTNGQEPHRGLRAGHARGRARPGWP